MRTQTYFHTKLEEEANRRNDHVPLQVNCVGMVAQPAFFCRSVRRDFYLIYVTKGKMVMAEQTVCAGEVLVYEPGQDYEYHNEGETVYYWVHYTGFKARSMTLEALGGLNVKKEIGIHKEIISCFQRLFREFIRNDEVSEAMSLCLLQEILLLTGRYAGDRQKKNVPLTAVEYIHRHFKEEIDVDMLAQMERMSATAFRIAFKEHTGTSPNEYIIAQRMSNACRLLAQTDWSVSEAAAESGYRDPYYFSRLFKKKMGISPLKYRYLQKKRG